MLVVFLKNKIGCSCVATNSVVSNHTLFYSVGRVKINAHQFTAYSHCNIIKYNLLFIDLIIY